MAQMRAEMMAAATSQDEVESGHKMLRSILVEKHNEFRSLADKCVKEALKALRLIIARKRKEQEETQAMRAPCVWDSLDIQTGGGCEDSGHLSCCDKVPDYCFSDRRLTMGIFW